MNNMIRLYAVLALLGGAILVPAARPGPIITDSRILNESGGCPSRKRNLRHCSAR
jgi:hypothetical protein